MAPIAFPSVRVAATCSARVAPVGDALVELLLVLEAPRLAGRDPDVELEVLRVVADGGAPKRLLEIEVPADEAALGAVPEVPDRVGLAGTSQDQHAVTTPVPTPCPGMRATVRARRKGERRLLGNVCREQPRRVVDHDDGGRLPRRPAPDLPVHDDVARLPAHRPKASGACARYAQPPDERDARARSRGGGERRGRRARALRRRDALPGRRDTRGAAQAADDDARGVRPGVRGALRRRRLDGRDVRVPRADPRRRRARPRCAAQAQCRPASGDACGALPRTRADRRDDGRRSAEPARGRSAARRGGRGGIRRRQRPPGRAPRLVGPDAAVEAHQRHAPPVHGRPHLGLRLRVQRLPARRRRADARRDRPAEVHEGARALGGRDRRRGRRRPRPPTGRVELHAASSHTPRAPRAGRLLAAADPDGRDRPRLDLLARVARARHLRARLLDHELGLPGPAPARRARRGRARRAGLHPRPRRRASRQNPARRGAPTPLPRRQGARREPGRWSPAARGSSRRT